MGYTLCGAKVICSDAFYGFHGGTPFNFNYFAIYSFYFRFCSAASGNMNLIRYKRWLLPWEFLRCLAARITFNRCGIEIALAGQFCYLFSSEYIHFQKNIRLRSKIRTLQLFQFVQLFFTFSIMSWNTNY